MMVFFVAAGMLLLPFDLAISRSLNHSGLPGDIDRMLALSEFFAHGFGVAVVLLSIWTLVPSFRRLIPRIAACAIVPGLIVNGLKLAIGRYRPNEFYESIDVASSTWLGLFPSWIGSPMAEFGYAIQSFPSGHTATAFGLAIGMSWLLPRGKFLFFFLAGMAALQRIAFQAHWPTDVLGAVAIAMFVSNWIIRDGSTADRWFKQIEARDDDTFADPNELTKAA